jgi:hypothetical protein
VSIARTDGPGMTDKSISQEQVKEQSNEDE